MSSSKKPQEMLALLHTAIDLAKAGDCKGSARAYWKSQTIRNGRTIAVPRAAVRIAVEQYDRLEKTAWRKIQPCFAKARLGRVRSGRR